MSAVEQILITHCTYGSSALERREGDFAHRMLGYSARAGSVDAAQLRNYYRQVERYAYYYLPRDTPVEEKLRLTAVTAPARMVYVPGSGGMEMLGMVSYRQTDTEGRPGSYFAHVLLREQQGVAAGWSALDCLRLWDASGWLREDSAALPFALPKLSGLQDMARGAAAAIDENVLLSFLTTPAGGEFTDPRGVIAPRWQQMEPAKRQEAFLRALSGLMIAASQPRMAVLLAIEPAMAALVFFGIFRLLPASLRRQISFSTFEPNPERLVTTLAATWFHKPEAADLRADAMRGRGLVVSTLDRHLAEPQSKTSTYARLILEKLLQGGWAGVDALLQTLQATAPSSLVDLERLAETESFVRGLLVPGGAAMDDSWRRSPAVEIYLRRRLAQEVAASGDVRGTLRGLVGSPQHLLLCELFAGQAAACDFLLAALAEERAAEAIAVPAISEEAKVLLLVRLIGANERLPRGCETLLGAAGNATAVFHPLMPQVLARLTPNQIDRLRAGLTPEQMFGLVAALAAACGSNRTAVESLSRAIRELDPLAILSLLDAVGSEFFKQYPHDEPVLGGRLAEVLALLPGEPAWFSRRVDLLLAGQHLLPTDAEQDAVAAWSRARRAMLQIGVLQKKAGGLFSGAATAELDAACRTMSEAVHSAWKGEEKEEGFAVPRKEQRLADLGCSLLGEPFLPRGSKRNQVLWLKIRFALEHGTWSIAKVRTMPGTAMAGKRPPWSAVAIIALSLGAIGFALFYFSPWWPTTHGDLGGGKAVATIARNANPAKKVADPQDSRSSEKKPPGKETLPADRSVKKETAPLPAGQEPPAADPKEAVLQEPAAEEPVAENPDEAVAEKTAKREAEWVSAARKFAAGNRGCVIEGSELEQGVYLLPPGAIEVADPPSRLCLGSGWVTLDGELFAFGDDFQSQPPTASQQLPRLAEKLGFAALELSVEARDSGVWLVGRGEKRRVDQAAVARLRDQVEKIKLRQSRSGGKKNELDNEANDEIRELETQIQKMNADVRAGNDEAARAWKDCRPSVAAILYQSGGGKAPSVPAVADAGLPRGDSPREEKYATIEGTFKIDVSTGSYRPDIPYIGKIRFSAVGAQPKWVHDGANIHVAIREYTEEGEVRSYPVVEVTKTKEHLILDGTKRMEVRYEFLPKGRVAGVADQVTAAATPWQVIEPVPSGNVWSVKLEVEKSAWDAMRKITARADGDTRGR